MNMQSMIDVILHSTTALVLLFCGSATGAEDLDQVQIPSEAEMRTVPHAASRGISTRKEIYLLGEVIVAERLYYEDGQLAEEKLFRDGKLHGVWTQYYKSGRPFSQRPFRHGLADGVFRFWGGEGQLLGESRMVLGNGVLREFELGALESRDSEATYENGRIHGYRKLWGHFQPGIGNGVDVTEFNQGEPSGWSATFDEDGVQLGAAYYRDGVLDGVVREWNRDGKLLDDYPKYYLKGSAVSKSEFDAAARLDPSLQESVKKDGSRLKGIAFPKERLQGSQELSGSVPKVEPMTGSQKLVSPGGDAIAPEPRGLASEHQPPALTDAEREQLQRRQLWKRVLPFWPVGVVAIMVGSVILIRRRSGRQSERS